jgi:hypothetical protein
MLGYDSNDDMLFEVHTKDVANSVALANNLQEVINDYKLNLKLKIQNPGTDRSDHASFWNTGIGAITYSQAFFNGDSNPNYHKATDRINVLSLPYFHELAKLSLANIATHAELIGKKTNDIPEDVPIDIATVNLKTTANSANGYSTISYTLPTDLEIDLFIYNPLTQLQTEIYRGNKNKGEHYINYATSALAPGVYFIVLNTKWGSKTQKLMVQK